MRHFDVIIIGGGVAGAATALMLKQHAPSLSVVLIERSTYDQVRIGETLVPQAGSILHQLGVWQDFLTQGYLPSYGTCAAWGQAELHHNEFIFSMHGQGWHLDRRAFDRWFASQAENRGVALYTNTRVVEHQQKADMWTLTVQHDASQQQLQTRFVVDATGRSAIFARQQQARRVHFDQLVGLFIFFHFETPPTDATTMVEAWEDGWWYSALLPDSQMVVACMSDADLVRTTRLKSLDLWLNCLKETRYTKKRLTEAKLGTDPQIYAAHTHRLEQVIGDGWLAVGDAATTFDPLSSQGIFKAMRSGVFAAYAISDHLNGDPIALPKYEKVVTQEFLAYLQTWQAYYSQEQRWPQSTFWHRRHQVPLYMQE
ncbi:NAD(P)/FAD-dependent oxidoreductase [Chloroflexi bacterium TSY]|nr:NAD(P)/FAD-dependent oxidoreductase [Chloroflexi bacterium TSY]